MNIKKIIEESKNKLIYTKMKQLNTPENSQNGWAKILIMHLEQKMV